MIEPVEAGPIGRKLVGSVNTRAKGSDEGKTKKDIQGVEIPHNLKSTKTVRFDFGHNTQPNCQISNKTQPEN